MLSPMVSPVQLILFTGELPVDFTKARNRCAEASAGWFKEKGKMRNGNVKFCVRNI